MNATFWKKVFFRGSAVFSAVSVFLLALWLIIFSSDKLSTLDISFPAYRMLMIALFSYMISFAFCFCRLEDMQGWIRVLVNYLFVTAGFFICIYMPTVQELPSAERPAPLIVVALIAIFSLLYFLCFGAYRLAVTLREKSGGKKSNHAVKAKAPEKTTKTVKKKSKKEEYVPMFSKSNEK